MKCACGYEGPFDTLSNTGCPGEFYILKPGMESKYEGIVELSACPKCKTVKVQEAK